MHVSLGALAGLTFETPFLAAPVAASVTRASDGQLLAVNDAWVALCGILREDAIGRTTVELGLWPNATDRDVYVSGLHAADSLQDLRLRDNQMQRVRLHTSVLNVQPEPLLLVYLSAVNIEHETDLAQQTTNRKLQQQIELHGAIEKLARVGHWTNATDDEAVTWSPGLIAMAGIDPHPAFSRIQGRGRIHPEDLPAWLEAREAMDGRTVEFRWMRPDKREIWLRTRMVRTAVAGNTQTDFGVVQDITAEMESAQALADQLKLIQNITARVPGILYQSRLQRNGEGSFSYMSEGAAEMLEMDPQALQRDGHLLFARIHPDDQKPLASAIVHSASKLTLARHLVRMVLPSKGLRWYSVEAMPQREAGGATLWHGFVSDVTESRLAEQALSRQNQMLDAVRQAQAVYIEADDKRRAFEALLTTFLNVTQSGYGFVGEVLYDMHEQPYLKTHAITDITWGEASQRMYDTQLDTGMEFHNLKTLFGHAMLSREAVIANDPAHDPRSGGVVPDHLPMTNFLGIPIAEGDRLVAMVGLANHPEGYSAADVEFLQPLLGAVRQLVLAWRGHAERKQARLQLQATSVLLAEKSAALQVTLDSMNQGLIMVDADGRVRFYNRRMLELLELPEELLSGEPRFTDVTAFQMKRGDFGDDHCWVDSRMRDIIGKDPDVVPPESYLRRTRQGQMLEIHTRMLSDGGMVRTYTDVTSYVRAEEALREERQRLQWVLEATRPGIWEANLRTGGLVINSRWAQMLGYTLSELEPTTIETWRQLAHPLDIERAEYLMQRHMRDEIPHYEADVRLRHKDGHWVWTNCRGRVHSRDESGQALFMSGTHLDIDDRVAAQEQVRVLNASLERRVAERTAALERSMNDMEAISYSIAHDLRTPLRSVNGFSALVAEIDGDRLSPQGLQMFERITRTSANMGQMLSDMLELLRVVRVPLEPMPVDMAALARSVVSALVLDDPQARIELQPIPTVMGDATLLRQVLVNLIDNALKYSRQQAHPELLLGYDANQNAFFLRDNGMGFDMAHAGKLFGLFQRLHAGSDVPGTGVGLAIVARIIERHGGRVWAESSVGAGATFWWTLPLN